MTGIPLGKVAVDSTRVIMVRSNPARWRAAVMGFPKLPEAWMLLEMTVNARSAYTEDGHFLNGSHC